VSTIVDVQGESIMKNNRVHLTVALAVSLAFIGVTFAQRPETDIDPARHPNLAEAQHHILQAAEKIDEAQKMNKDELGGHAEKAKQLLDQASRELKEAAEYADHRRK
jgi:F0F1-type ATP synthase membrane subunit b/b'